MESGTSCTPAGFWAPEAEACGAVGGSGRQALNPADVRNLKLLVPCRAAPSKSGRATYSMAVLCSDRGEFFIPAFTDREELAKWPYPADAAALLTYDEIKHRAIDCSDRLSGIAINPFGKMLLLRMDQIRRIDMETEGMSVERVEHGKDLKFLPPRGKFPGLTEELKAFLRARDEVYRVYLLLAQEPFEREPHWLILVDFDGERSAVFPEIARIVRPHMKPGDTFELMKATHALLERAARCCRPVYSKLDVVR